MYKIIRNTANLLLMLVSAICADIIVAKKAEKEEEDSAAVYFDTVKYCHRDCQCRVGNLCKYIDFEEIDSRDNACTDDELFSMDELW